VRASLVDVGMKRKEMTKVCIHLESLHSHRKKDHKLLIIEQATQVPVSDRPM
jgi:hypothetical protein